MGHATQRLAIGEMIDGYTATRPSPPRRAEQGARREGQFADLVVLSRDVRTRPPAAADDVQVQTIDFGVAVVTGGRAITSPTAANTVAVSEGQLTSRRL